MALLIQTSKRILGPASSRITSPTRDISSRRSQHAVAIVRDIPDSFVDAVVAHSDHPENVSLAVARSQHGEYVAQLRRHVNTVRLPPLESHPDCLFVEDTVVAMGDTAVINRLGHVSRRGEVDSLKDLLLQLGMANLYDMRESNNDEDAGEPAMCDGGDVMHTGRHLFIGMSGRTNANGFKFLRDAFVSHGVDADKIVSVPPVVAGKQALHLKSVVTHIDEHTVLAPVGAIGDTVLDAMKATKRGYNAIRPPDMLSCNAVVVNRHVLAQDTPCEVSKSRIEAACEERNLGLTFVDTSELAKKDGALTCCSVLLSV